MKTTRLREMLRDRGDVGVLLVGLFLLAHHVWTRRRLLLISVCVLLAGSSLFLCLRPHPASNRRPTASQQAKPKAAVSSRSTEVLQPEEPSKDGPGSNYRPSKPLLSVATIMVALPNYYQNHSWLDKNRVLLIFNDGKNYDNFEMYSQWKGRADLLDRRTGRQQPMLGLTHLLNKMGWMTENFELSPNGKWLTWHYSGGLWPRTVLAHLDGSHLREPSQMNYSEKFWLDDHRWAEAETRELYGCPMQLNVFDPEDPMRSVSYRLDSAPAKKLLRLHYSSEPSIFDVDGAENSTRASNSVEINEYRWATTDRDDIAKLVHTYPVALPKGIRFVEAVVSQKVRRVVYHVRYRTMLSGYLQPQLVDCLWSSDLQGSHLREIGYVQSEEVNDEARTPEFRSKRLTEVHWIPGDSQVEFTYQGTLYIVPVR